MPKRPSRWQPGSREPREALSGVFFLSVTPRFVSGSVLTAGLPPCISVKENGSRPWPFIACLKIVPLDRTRSRSLPPREEALRTLRLANRSDPRTEIVAKKIIELAQRGERDPVRLRECAIRSLTSASPPEVESTGRDLPHTRVGPGAHDQPDS